MALTRDDDGVCAGPDPAPENRIDQVLATTPPVHRRTERPPAPPIPGPSQQWQEVILIKNYHIRSHWSFALV